MLRAGGSGSEFRYEKDIFVRIFHKFPGRHWTHPAFSSIRTVAIPWRQSGRGLKLTNHLHLVQSYTSPPPIRLNGGEGETTFHNKERSSLLNVCRVQLAHSLLVLISTGKFWDKKVAWWNWSHFRLTTRVFVSHDSCIKTTKGKRRQNCHGDRNFRDSLPLRVRQITAPSSVGACHYVTQTLTGELSPQCSVLRMENLTFQPTTSRSYCL